MRLNNLSAELISREEEIYLKRRGKVKLQCLNERGVPLQKVSHSEGLRNREFVTNAHHTLKILMSLLIKKDYIISNCSFVYLQSSRASLWWKYRSVCTKLLYWERTCTRGETGAIYNYHWRKIWRTGSNNYVTSLRERTVWEEGNLTITVMRNY